MYKQINNDKVRKYISKNIDDVQLSTYLTNHTFETISGEYYKDVLEVTIEIPAEEVIDINEVMNG